MLCPNFIIYVTFIHSSFTGHMPWFLSFSSFLFFFCSCSACFCFYVSTLYVIRKGWAAGYFSLFTLLCIWVFFLIFPFPFLLLVHLFHVFPLWIPFMLEILCTFNFYNGTGLLQQMGYVFSYVFSSSLVSRPTSFCALSRTAGPACDGFTNVYKLLK